MSSNYQVVTSPEDIRAYIGTSRIVAFDFETAPDAPYREEARAALDPAKAHNIAFESAMSYAQVVLVGYNEKLTLHDRKRTAQIERTSYIKR